MNKLIEFKLLIAKLIEFRLFIYAHMLIDGIF